jgi:hypothetical protein
MFFVRILFFCDRKLIFENLSEEPIELFQNEAARCIVKKKRQGEKTKVILEYGGFQEEEKAREEGIKLLRNVKLQMCKYNNPINISGINGMLDCKEHSVMPARFTEDGLSFIKQKLIESGMISAYKIVMEDVLGLEIYNVKSSMDEIHFVAQDFEITYKTDFTLNRMDYRFWSEKLDVALSFLNTSILINDVRIKFLLKIMAIEVLVSEKEKENEEYVNAIESIMRTIDISTEYGKKLKNDIGRLKIKSIGKKCKNLIEKYCSEKAYAGLDALSFFDKCYKLRSGLVHSGKMNMEELGVYDEALKRLVVDTIENISCENRETSN